MSGRRHHSVAAETRLGCRLTNAGDDESADTDADADGGDDDGEVGDDRCGGDGLELMHHPNR